MDILEIKVLYNQDEFAKFLLNDTPFLFNDKEYFIHEIIPTTYTILPQYQEKSLFLNGIKVYFLVTFKLKNEL